MSKDKPKEIRETKYCGSCLYCNGGYCCCNDVAISINDYICGAYEEDDSLNQGTST